MDAWRNNDVVRNVMKNIFSNDYISRKILVKKYCGKEVVFLII